MTATSVAIQEWVAIEIVFGMGGLCNFVDKLTIDKCHNTFFRFDEMPEHWNQLTDDLVDILHKQGFKGGERMIDESH